MIKEYKNLDEENKVEARDLKELQKAANYFSKNCHKTGIAYDNQ